MSDSPTPGDQNLCIRWGTFNYHAWLWHVEQYDNIEGDWITTIFCRRYGDQCSLIGEQS